MRLNGAFETRRDDLYYNAYYERCNACGCRLDDPRVAACSRGRYENGMCEYCARNTYGRSINDDRGIRNISRFVDMKERNMRARMRREGVRRIFTAFQKVL